MNKKRKAKKAIKLGKYYSKKGNYKKGLEFFLKGIGYIYSNERQDGKNYHSIALLYQELGEEENAEKFIKMSKRVFQYSLPEHDLLWQEDLNLEENYEEIGYEFLEKNKYQEALENLLKVILLKGCWSEILLHDIAYCYENIGDFENSEKYIKKCLEISPGYLNGKKFLGNLYIDMGKKEEGEKILEECKKEEEKIKNMNLDLDIFYNTK